MDYAIRLLAVLRAGGRDVRLDGDLLLIDGPPLTVAQEDAVRAHWLALRELLIAEQAPPSTSPDLSDLPQSWLDLIGPPPPVDMSLPVGPKVAGIPIATFEWQRWRALRDRAVTFGLPFDLPELRYRYR